MIAFSLRFDTDFAYLDLEQEKRGLFSALRRRESRNLLALPKEERAVAVALSRLRHLDPERRLHTISESGLRIAHALVAKLDSIAALALGLPGLVTGITFRAAMRGTVGSPDFKIEWWFERNGRTTSMPVIGAFVGPQSQPMRLPEPIFHAIKQAAALDPKGSVTDHWLALGTFRRLFDSSDSGKSAAELEGLLKNISVITSDAIGLSVDDDDASLFFPVPFVSAERDVNGEIPSSDAALQGAELAEFQRSALRRGAQPAYRVADNKFLIVDRSAVPVLRTIADYAQRDPETRKAFVADAGRIISDAIERQMLEDGRVTALMSPEAQSERVEAETAKAWVETLEWVSRVTGIAKWQASTIDPMQGSGTKWLPSSIEPALGELLGLITDEELADVVDQVRDAIDRGQPSVKHEIGDIPAIPVVLEALSRRLAELLRRKEEDEAGTSLDAYLPVTHDNFWEMDFKARVKERAAPSEFAVPTQLVTELQQHQVKSLHWQIDAWSAGLPGILNADEQGLGKTLQTLAFIVWLKGQMNEGTLPHRPFLIVAPTSLLLNWEAEIERHLQSGFLGTPIRLFGNHLSQYKKDDADGQDIREGDAQLDLSKVLSQANGSPVIITTYQTLANYAISLMSLDCAVAVFDEIQFVKNPITMRAKAAKSVKAAFKIGLTGTPIENATHDLWALIDQLFPGALGVRAEFKRVFDAPTEQNMSALHRALFYSQHGRPALAMRRLKTDAAPQLPTKVRVLHPREMPPAQMVRYDEARLKGGMMLALLHHIRRTSLHPGLLEGETPDDFTASSARVSAAVDILRHIRQKGERALVFVENRDVQQWFAEIIRLEFDLERVMIINGDTTIDARKEITDRFQRHLVEDKGFDVLVLGPRAAGTGLTLTAANHVIHLSRWWNPAVEEQCNDRTHRIGQTKPVTVHIPLAVHPGLGPGSFDCLLQRFMKRKRSLAESILWPAEATEGETKLLYDAVITASTPPVSETVIDFDKVVVGRGDLIADLLSENTIRLRLKRGGAGVIVSHEPTFPSKFVSDADDAVVITLNPHNPGSNASYVPHSKLSNLQLWPDYILPE